MLTKARRAKLIVTQRNNVQQPSYTALIKHSKGNTFSMTVDFHRFVENLTAMIEAKDFYTSGHSDRVADLSYMIAMAMGFDQAFCDRLHIGAHLHDIGKIGIPDGILLKSSKLTAEEYAVIKTHAVIGYDILKNNPGLMDIPITIRHHHERFDGKGYPDGIAGSDIPIGSRIITLADSFDAMVTNRPYKAVKSVSEACTEIRRCSDTQFDPDIASVFLDMMSDKKDSQQISAIFGSPLAHTQVPPNGAYTNV